MQFHPSITIASSSSSSSAAGRINDDEPINICIHQENGQQSKSSHLLLSVTVWQSSGSRTFMSKGQIQRPTSNPVWRGDPFWPTRPQQSRCTQKFSPPTAPHSAAGENAGFGAQNALPMGWAGVSVHIAASPHSKSCSSHPFALYTCRFASYFPLPERLEKWLWEWACGSGPVDSPNLNGFAWKHLAKFLE